DSARDVRSVTILGPEGLFTDALSTAVFVLGLEQGLRLIDSLAGVDAVLVDGTGALRYSADIDPLR
ncbi:MAG: FAD:protein FMN transferase, partial [Congregibacter sp.]|nr:FAD:protein FMN transferase [Congregibacter sp.]